MLSIIDVCDELVNSLNGESAFGFSMAYVSVREYVPEIELSDTSLRVSVVPASQQVEPYDRSNAWYVFTVDLAVRKKLDFTDEENNPVNSQIDLLMRFMDELILWARGRHLQVDASTAFWQSTTRDPMIAPEHLESFGQFTSVLSITYRVMQ